MSILFTILINTVIYVGCFAIFVRGILYGIEEKDNIKITTLMAVSFIATCLVLCLTLNIMIEDYFFGGPKQILIDLLYTLFTNSMGFLLLLLVAILKKNWIHTKLDFLPTCEGKNNPKAIDMKSSYIGHIKSTLPNYAIITLLVMMVGLVYLCLYVAEWPIWLLGSGFFMTVLGVGVAIGITFVFFLYLIVMGEIVQAHERSRRRRKKRREEQSKKRKGLHFH